MDETTVQQNVSLILVVDDDRMMRRMVRRALESRGYAVEEAEDGAQALSAYERLQPDIVLLDILMPEMDGFATLARLQALPGGDRTPVLMITAFDDKASVDRAFEAGATDYITKPIHLEVLRHRVHRLLRARQAEEALRESEERFRTLFESVPIGIYRTTPDGRILMANPAAIRMLGHDSFEELAALDLEKESPQIGYPRREFRERIERDGEIRGLETVWTRKDNSVIFVRENARVVRDASGTVLHYEGTLEDITERKRAEEALRERTHELGERVKELNCLYGLSNLVEKPDTSLEEILQGAVDLIPPAWQYPEITCARVILEGQEFRTENFRETVWKQTGDIVVHGERVGTVEVGYLKEKPEGDEGPFLKEESSLLNAIVQRLGRIIEHKRAEEALRLFEAIVEASQEAIVISDSDGQLVYINPAHKKLFGRPLEEARRLNYRDYYPPESLEVLNRDVAPALARGESWEGELDVFNADGRRFPLWERADSVRDADGKMLYGFGFMHDVTGRRRLEQQMRQQDRMAALGHLAGGIAHDFNNILTGITLSAQILLGQRHLPPDLTSDLESILADARQAARLVRQILDFSHRSFFETHPVDLRRITQESADILRRTLPENIRFLLEAGRGECVVNADPTRMQQVLTNLALNAQDAMPEGGELRIGLSRVQVKPGEEPPVEGMSPGEWVCLAVSDTGTGIPPEVMARLFEPFFTTKPVGQGTGMGLAQVHGIVKQHEGHIGVETEVGQGTTFRIYLPAQRAGGTEEAPLEEAASAALEQERETILLVEDEKKVQRFGQRALELLGYRVLTAANGQEALEVYRSAERIDLVLTDIVMPEMGGRELMRELRKMNPRVKAVVVTGYAMEEDLRELREEGIVDVIHKPFDLSTLKEVVRHALDGD